jgi:peptidoglycan/xylan/chitin deacetylase (PgdA/CDA1 family)
MAKEIQCAFGVDIDAVAGWLGSYGGEDSPSDIQRGVFAGEVGTPRLLKLFDKFKIKASSFIPGHSIETLPEQTKMIAAAGHEIGAHGYSHENPVAMTPQQEEDVLEKIDRVDREILREEAAWLCCAAVGNVRQYRRAVTEKRLPLRPQPGLQRFRAVLRPRSEIPGPRSIIPRKPPNGCGR